MTLKKNLKTQVSFFFFFFFFLLPFSPLFTSLMFIMLCLQRRGSNKARNATGREPFKRTTVWEAEHTKVSTKCNIQLLCVHLKVATPELTESVCFISFVIAFELY